MSNIKWVYLKLASATPVRGTFKSIKDDRPFWDSIQTNPHCLLMFIIK